MSHLIECKQCGETHWDDHRCPSVYYYTIPGEHSEDEWIKVRAHSFSGAVERACDDYDSGNYSILRRGYLEEILIKDEDGNVKRFKVTAQAQPCYIPEEIKEAKP